MSPSMTNDVDSFVKNEFVPFRERLVEALSKKHPQLFTFIGALFTNQQGNKFGLQVTENGQTIGEYSLDFNGTKITNVESGRLDSAIHHPFLGTIKPYVSIERKTLEKIIDDEDKLVNDPIPNAAQYLPDVTVHFLH
ncbi:MAG TPA: hypothetical protein DDW50_12340 [Firmicutes bacterium]|jgi:hypothetical protein|nr:hypothetical protein [Bacillota bacterium]